MKYNYVVFNSVNTDLYYNRDDDYYVICLKDLEARDDVILNHVPLQEQPVWMRRLYNLHHSRWLYNKYWKFPFRSIWHPYIFKNTFSNNKPICFVCLRYPSIGYLRYLKKKYPDCKIVKMSRDLIIIQEKMYKSYTRARVFDLWMSYDEGDCSRYGFIHFDEFESKINIPIDKSYPLSDVFYAGVAKDRVPRLIRIYDKLSQKGIKCFFIIVDAKEEEKVSRDGIRFLDIPLTYTKMLWYTVNSKCVLEINRTGASGYTSRFLEAVMFNNMLITDNKKVRTTSYYNPLFMQIIESEDDIDVEMIKASVNVDYNYNNEFSPTNRLELIDSLISDNSVK